MRSLRASIFGIVLAGLLGNGSGALLVAHLEQESFPANAACEHPHACGAGATGDPAPSPHKPHSASDCEICQLIASGASTLDLAPVAAPASDETRTIRDRTFIAVLRPATTRECITSRGPPLC